MPIIGPADLPSIMKVNSTPMKKYVLSKLGYPNVNVEIQEDQWETIWKVAADFISSYFPREQKLGLFYTQPLKSTYPLPKDAYWIEDVKWDPVTTRIDDVFGAESFLFCLNPEFLILDKHQQLQPLGDWKPHWEAKTPYGNSPLTIKHHENTRKLPKIKINYQNGSIEATSNHVIQANHKWREFAEVVIGDTLQMVTHPTTVISIEVNEDTNAIGVRSEHGCYYGCSTGEPILLH